MILPAEVFFDDFSYVAANPLFAKPLSGVLSGLLSRNYFAETGERTWQPLATLLNYWLSGSPAAWRVLGILLHACAAWLVRLLAKRLDASEPAAGFAAFMFLFFPLSTEAVFFAAFRGHQLAAIAVLASLILWIDGRRTAAVLAMTAGLLAKETALVSVGLIALWEIVHERKSVRNCLPNLSTLAGVAIAYGVFRFGILIPAPAQVSAASRQPVSSLGWYLTSLIVPWPACLFRSLSASYALAIFPFAGLCWFFRKNRPVLFSLLLIPVALAPFLHALPFAFYNPVADRYLYLPAAGLALSASLLMAESRARLVLLVWTAALAGMTMIRNGQFRDLQALGEQCVDCAPEHPQAYAMSGQQRMAAGDYSNAGKRFEKAVELAPGDPSFHDSLGLTKYATGYKEQAVEQFRLAASLGPGAAPWSNLGAALAALGRKKEALEAYDEAVRRAPGWEKPAKAAAELRRRK